MSGYELLVFDWNGTLSNGELQQTPLDIAPLFDGVPECLQQLADGGYQLAIATNMGSHSLLQELDCYQIRALFVGHQCPDMGPAKPHPAMLLDLIERCGTEVQKTLMVGDTLQDMQLAHNAGVDSVLISQNARALQGEVDITPPKVVLPSVLELTAWLSAH